MHNKGVVKERLSKKVTIATEDMVSAAALYKTSNVASLPVGLRDTSRWPQIFPWTDVNELLAKSGATHHFSLLRHLTPLKSVDMKITSTLTLSCTRRV
jgi:hypothetical protein